LAIREDLPVLPAFGGLFLAPIWVTRSLRIQLPLFGVRSPPQKFPFLAVIPSGV
jgi:hypothetical protein